MITEKFKKYINGFRDKYGRVSKDDCFKIGIEHQKLPRCEKSWTELAKLLDVPYSGEQFRKIVLRKRYSKGLVEKNPAVISNGDIGNMAVNDASGVLAQQLESLEKKKVNIRDSFNAYRRYLRDDARIESLCELMKECAQKQIALTPIKYVGTNQQNKSEGILMLSDWHIGQETDNFYNTFNYGVARERVMKVVSSAVDYCKLHKVKTLHVLNLGDLVEGIINTSARIDQTEDVAEQLMQATELMAEALNILQMAAPVVTYRMVVDNHGRFVADKHCSIAKENFNRLTTWYLKERLKNTSIIFKEDNLDIGLGRFSLDNNMKVAFFHGHEGRKNTTLQDTVGAVQEWTDIVCCGHWHCPEEKVFQNMRLFINGSLCGTGSYALSHRLFNKPSQKLIIVEDNNFINLDISAI